MMMMKTNKSHKKSRTHGKVPKIEKKSDERQHSSLPIHMQMNHIADKGARKFVF